jgi:hypothetical protein
MARSLLGTTKVEAPGLSTLSSAAPRTSGPRLTGAALQARLRQKRSAAYMVAAGQLDAGGHVHGASASQAIADAVRREFPDVEIDSLPLGIVARCHLGAPYEVHSLDCTGSIIRHFKKGEPLPQDMERARSLAYANQYAFIEVYRDKLIAVSASGQAAIIPT